eukprot:259904-Chlamydomonas_euryale.AAC.2
MSRGGIYLPPKIIAIWGDTRVARRGGKHTRAMPGFVFPRDSDSADAKWARGIAASLVVGRGAPRITRTFACPTGLQSRPCR